MKLQKNQQLLWLEEIEKRKGLTPIEQRELNHMRAGFNGEEYFGKYMQEKMPRDWLLLQDVRLKTSHGEIQMDAILFNNLGLTLFEIKNYSADYQYTGGRWKVNGKIKYHDDFLQIERTTDLLKYHLQQHGIKIPVQSFVIYINVDDTVEIDDPSLPFIKHAKLGCYIKNSIKNCQVAPTQTYYREAEWLVSQHQIDDRRFSLTNERFDTIQKGFTASLATLSTSVSADTFPIARTVSLAKEKPKRLFERFVITGFYFLTQTSIRLIY